MSTPPRNLPRFLPTLTEVVHAPTLARAAALTTPDREEIAKSVMQRLDGLIERRLREETEAMFRTTVTEQLQTLRSDLLQELEGVVRQAVSEAFIAQAEAHKSK